MHPRLCIDLEQWPVRLEQTLADKCSILKRTVVMRETDSTQDAARRMKSSAGDVVIAGRQTAGRGRLGRPWVDTGEQGLALTIIVNRDVLLPQRLAIAAAVGVALAVESFATQPVHIKWPNDILVGTSPRKLAGILIEQFDSLAFIGIGLNVHQTSWPLELTDRAVSLQELGIEIDRLDVLESLLIHLDRALQMDSAALVKHFTKRDWLNGKIATFQNGEATVRGLVRRVDPMQGLLVETELGETWLNAAQTSVVTVGTSSE